MDEVIYRLSEFCEALSNAVRLEIVMELRDNQRYYVGQMATKIDRSQSATSRQLGNLSKYNLVESETEKNRRYYWLKRPELIEKFLEIKPFLSRED